MFSTKALRIEVHRRANRDSQKNQVTTLEVQEEGALIGSGSHCDVRLAPDEAAVEQLFLEIVGDDVHALVKAMNPACRLHGAPFLEGKLSASALLEIGQLAIRAQVIGRKDGASVAPSKSGASTSRPVQALGLVAVGLGLYAVLHGPGKGDGVVLAAINPPGVRAFPEASCPQREPSAALALAEQLSVEAAIKRERSPFHPGEALAGAPLYARAAGCFALAGDHEAAHDAERAARGLQAQVAYQVRLAHVRIERSLEQKNYEAARRNAEFALALVPATDSYGEWLLSVKRASALQAAQGAGKW